MKPELVREERLDELRRAMCYQGGEHPCSRFQKDVPDDEWCKGCSTRRDFLAFARAVLKELGVDAVFECPPSDIWRSELGLNKAPTEQDQLLCHLLQKGAVLLRAKP